MVQAGYSPLRAVYSPPRAGFSRPRFGDERAPWQLDLKSPWRPSDINSALGTLDAAAAVRNAVAIRAAAERQAVARRVQSEAKAKVALFQCQGAGLITATVREAATFTISTPAKSVGQCTVQDFVVSIRGPSRVHARMSARDDGSFDVVWRPPLS